ncbi:MAG: hypothetical protein M1812_002346 [Candelaria pacifica]|nr:MAG: hypothetical protein M1812_002346 [Candelaria pacifica]
MDKIKNIIHPGKKEEDDVLYGSGRSSDPVHSGSAGNATGHGSHLGSSSGTGQHHGTDGPIGSSATGTTTSGHATGNTSYPSRSLMPGEFPDDNASIASIKSGVHGSSPGSKLTGSPATGGDTGLDVNKPLPHTPASGGIGSGSGLTGSNLPDRSVGGSGHGITGSENISSERSFPLGGQTGTTHSPGNTGSGLTGSNLGGTSSQSHSTGGYGTGTGPTSSTMHQGHLGRDAALGTGVAGAGLAEHERHGHGTTAGPHSSDIANRADPRVDSDLSGSRATGPTGYGSSTGGLGSSIGTTGTNTSTHQHGHLGHGHVYEGDPCPPGEHHNVLTTGPHSVDAANLLDPHVPRDGLRSTGTEHAGTGLASGTSGIGIGSGATGLGSTSTTARPHSSNLANKADPRVDSDRDGSRLAGTTGAPGYGSSSTTAGPHSSNLANKADPRVDSDRDGSRVAGSTGLPGYGASAVGGTTAGTSTTGPTGGSSDYRNPYSSSGIDPRVDSTPRSTETGTSGGHHLGRDAGIVGGAGALGAGAYEAERHHGSHQPTSTSAAAASGYEPSGTTAPSSGTTDFAHPSSTTHGYNNQQGDRHLGRDAGIIGGAGTLGAGAYEADKHHHGSHQPTSTSATGSSSYPSNTTGLDDRSRTGDHHLGRDAGVVGGAGILGAGAYEADKHHHGSHQPASTSATGASGYPSNTTGLDDRSRTGDHHLGRDAGIVGGAGALGAGAYEAEKHHASHQPTSTSTAGTTGYPSNTSGYDDSSRTAHDHHGREAAAAGTAGAIGGGAAGSELTKHQAEKREKELAKERAQHEKELHKAEKQHEKDVAKHEKAHEKEVVKHDKHHEKDLAKHDQKHEKELTELEKHERAKEHDQQHAHGEKKHGGLFGFLHRDKTDPELKEEEAARQERLHHGSGATTGAGAAGVAGTTAAAYGEEHEGRNRLHKDPPADHVPMKEGGAIRGGSGTGYEHAPQSGYASQVTGGTGTTALSTGTAPRGGTSGTGNDSNVVIEPHTGLPMDLSKGDGRGGTDANPIPGYHDHHSGAQR